MGRDPTFDDLRIRSGIPCVRGDERGTLRHTWLERRLLYEVRMDRAAWLSAAPGDPLPEVVAGIPAQLERLRCLIDRMVDDFSPAQLVDQGPLSRLDDGSKDLLRSVLHDAYLKSGIILPHQERLQAATDAFARIATQAGLVWSQGDRRRTTEFLIELECAALRLKDALALPQGVVLP